MATLQEEENLVLIAQEEMSKIVSQKAMELTRKGEVELAAQLLIELARTKLPDSHPSKGLRPKRVLIGEEVSQLSDFEQKAQKTKAGMAFAHALFSGSLSTDMDDSMTAVERAQKAGLTTAHTLENIGTYLLHNHTYLLPELTKMLLHSKREAGLIPALEQLTEQSAIAEPTELAEE